MRIAGWYLSCPGRGLPASSLILFALFTETCLGPLGCFLCWVWVTDEPMRKGRPTAPCGSTDRSELQRGSLPRPRGPEQAPLTTRLGQCPCEGTGPTSFRAVSTASREQRFTGSYWLSLWGRLSVDHFEKQPWGFPDAGLDVGWTEYCPLPPCGWFPGDLSSLVKAGRRHAICGRKGSGGRRAPGLGVDSSPGSILSTTALALETRCFRRDCGAGGVSSCLLNSPVDLYLAKCL